MRPHISIKTHTMFLNSILFEKYYIRKSKNKKLKWITHSTYIYSLNLCLPGLGLCVRATVTTSVISSMVSVTPFPLSVAVTASVINIVNIKLLLINTCLQFHDKINTRFELLYDISGGIFGFSFFPIHRHRSSNGANGPVSRNWRSRPFSRTFQASLRTDTLFFIELKGIYNVGIFAPNGFKMFHLFR